MERKISIKFEVSPEHHRLSKLPVVLFLVRNAVDRTDHQELSWNKHTDRNDINIAFVHETTMSR